MSCMLFIIVVMAIFAGLVTRKAWQIRRVSRIAVHPPVDELLRDRAPARVQRFLGEVEPQLLQMGFHALGNVHRFELRASLVWTGVFFVNREIGERVSVGVGSWGPPKAYQFAISWTTEFADGHRVVTHWMPPSAGGSSGNAGSAVPTAETPIAVDLGAWHRRRVEQAIVDRASVGMPTPPERVLPSSENESVWIRSTADQMAKKVASSLNWRTGLTGRYYEPGWPEVSRAALGGSRIERQTASQGFEVMTTPRPVAALKAEPVADDQSKEEQVSR